MTANERTTIADRCARCDGTPDAQALLAELRAQLEEARRERDAMRAAADAAGVRIAELRAELIDVRSEAASYANAIGLIESTLGLVGGGLLCKTTRAVDALVKQLADARLSAEQAVKVAEALAAVALTDVYRVSELKKRVALLEDLLRRYRDHHDDLTHEVTGGDDAGCDCSLCDEAHDVLEVEP